jgi:hypothetical protein
MYGSNPPSDSPDKSANDLLFDTVLERIPSMAAEGSGAKPATAGAGGRGSASGILSGTGAAASGNASFTAGAELLAFMGTTFLLIISNPSFAACLNASSRAA